jgi:hypothetical protein
VTRPNAPMFVYIVSVMNLSRRQATSIRKTRRRSSVADGRGRRLFQRRKRLNQSWPGCYLLGDDSAHRWFGHVRLDSTARLSIRVQRADAAHTGS